MLTEEALILLATLGASGMLILGVIELMWPSPPSHATPRRVRVVPSRLRVDIEPHARTDAPPAPFAAVIIDPPEAISFALPASELPVTTDVTPIVAAPMVDEPPPAPLASSMHGEPRSQVLPIDACLAMYDDRRFAEVVSLGSAALELHAGMAVVSDRPDEAAALFDLVGRSKQELGDRDGARAAFRAAIRRAGPRVRATYVRHLLTLVRSAADPALAAEENDASRLRELRTCMAALDEALALVPGDETVHATQVMVRETLSPVCERLVARAVSGDEDQDARELVLDTLTDHAMPAAWREGLREQLTSVSSAEIGQLTAQAIRSVQQGKDIDALDALDRAQRLSESLPEGAVSEDRREEFERRLWWGYTKVGLRRIETGSFESALEPLFRALRFGGIDEERLSETRGALARALESVVDTTSRTIQNVGVADIRGAQAEIEKLTALLQSAAEHGLTPDELGDAVAKLTQLEQSLSEARA